MGGRLPGCNFKSHPKPPKPKLKKQTKNNNTCVDTTISNVLCDLPFTLRTPLLSGTLDF
jgi:hypothetical protein